MPLTFTPQCCDADGYLALGQACAEHLGGCWHWLRPTGAIFYFSLPFRLGLAPEWIIVLNAILFVAAVAVGLRAMIALSPWSTPVSRAALAIAFPVAHAFFMAGTLRTSLSDGPSACAAMIALWTLVLGVKRNSWGLYTLAGAVLGLSVILRAFYLYPALIAAAGLVVLTLMRKQGRLAACLFCAALAAPILLQVVATHEHTRSWSFLDPTSTGNVTGMHFQTDAYGYDTLLPGKGEFYGAPECFRDSSTLGEALRNRDWDEALCLVARRQWFYFGSYVPAGQTYLERASQRHFSMLFLVANALATGVAFWWAFSWRVRTQLLLVPLLFFGASLAEASAIIPEARFLMAVHVTIWMFAIMGVHELALQLVRGHSVNNPSCAATGT